MTTYPCYACDAPIEVTDNEWDSVSKEFECPHCHRMNYFYSDGDRDGNYHFGMEKP